MTLLGNDEGALALLNRALQLRPTFPEAWFNKGVALGKLGRIDEAVGWLCRALHAFETDWTRRAQVESALQELGRDPAGCVDIAAP